MKKPVVAVIAVWLAAVGWIHPASAQEQQKGVPIEFFACNWQDGKGMADLDKVTKKFNEWSDKNDGGYSAWVLTPQFHNGVAFDVGWLGAWPDGNAFGKGQDMWRKGGRELAADFASVVDCSAMHGLATSAVVHAPNGPGGDGVVMFAQCTMQDGKSPAAALPAHKKAAAAMVGMGSKASSWLFYPGLGAGNIDFHYWQVIAFNNYEELGAATELYINGGGWEKVMGILGPVSRCASPTVYDATVVRTGSGG